MGTMDKFEQADQRFEPVRTSRTFNRILDTFSLRDKKVLDLGCGYGEYLVNFGEGSLGVTTTVEEVVYGKERSLRIMRGNAELLEELDLNEQFDGVWANNLFEHLLAPHSFLVTLKTLAKDKSLLVLGVPVVPKFEWLMQIRRFRGALAIPHINFFTRETLKLTVERSGWMVKEVRSFKFQNAFLDRLYGFIAPHMYVVAYNDAHFMYPEKKLLEWKNEPHYQKLLRINNRA